MRRPLSLVQGRCQFTVLAPATASDPRNPEPQAECTDASGLLGGMLVFDLAAEAGARLGVVECSASEGGREPGERPAIHSGHRYWVLDERGQEALRRRLRFIRHGTEVRIFSDLSVDRLLALASEFVPYQRQLT